MNYKYHEDEILQEIQNHIDSTYNQHYSNEDGSQCFDIMRISNCLFDYCKGNAFKYVTRYGEKDGYNRVDILKAIHCLIILLNESERLGLTKQQNDL